MKTLREKIDEILDWYDNAVSLSSPASEVEDKFISLFKNWALETVGEDDKVKDWFSDYIGYNRAKQEIRERIKKQK